MEIGELASVAAPSQDADEKCPFDHNRPPDEEVKNELGGVGTTLGSNMADGKGVHASLTGDKTPDPREGGLRSVTIKVNDKTIELNGKPLPYPLTCAAHHLIPAQESLKGHPVLNWMCEKGKQQDFLNGKAKAPATVGGSRVWANAGYNVNGSQNGTWLPGNYAVGGGRGGAEVWKSRATDGRSAEANDNWAKAVDLQEEDWTPHGDPVENEEPQPGSVGAALAEALASANPREYLLAGTNYVIEKANPKWSYVKAAMDAARGQFHDRHSDYSNEVKKYLSERSPTCTRRCTSSRATALNARIARRRSDPHPRPRTPISSRLHRV